jgi:HEAT repeat protein
MINQKEKVSMKILGGSISECRYNFGNTQDLIKALKDKNPKVRSWAAYNIGQKGLSAEEAFPGLIDVLKDEDRDVRLKTVGTLRDLGEPRCVTTEEFASKVIPALVTLLRNEREDKTVQFWAVIALAKFGSMDTTKLVEAVRGH